MEHPSGIQIWVNGVVAFERLGLTEAMRDRVEPVEDFEFLSLRGRRLVHIPVVELARRRGTPPPITIRRPDRDWPCKWIAGRGMAKSIAAECAWLGATAARLPVRDTTAQSGSP